MKKIILLSLLIISISTEAQVQFYIEPSANISLISNSQATRTNEVATDRPGNQMVRKENYSAIYTNKVGGGITAGLNYFFKEDFSLDAGLDFNNVNFHQKARTSISHVYMPLNGNAESTETAPVMTVKSDDSHSLLHSFYTEPVVGVQPPNLIKLIWEFTFSLNTNLCHNGVSWQVFRNTAVNYTNLN